MAEARAKGICLDGFEKIRSGDRDEMIEYYLKIIDWSLERSFPDLHVLTESFADCEDKGIFVGKTFHGELLNDLQTYVFHKCKGTISVGLNVDKAIIPMLYLANGCRLHIMGVGDIKPRKRSEVPIYTFGKNDVSARDNRYVKFIHHKRELS